jgi:hypothetical protein
MNLADKGWFKRLISSQAGIPEEKLADRDAYLYKNSHSSGLIYGHPVLPKEFKSAEFMELSQSAKLKLVLLDGFIKTAVFPSKEQIPDDPDEFVRYLSESIIEYYSEVIPNKKVKERNFWGKKLSNEEIVESLLNDRLNEETLELDNFWISFFNNSLLFLDVFFFGEWIVNRHEEATVQKIQEHRDSVHLLLLQVMACAANADHTIQEEEKVLFNQFLASAHLPENLELQAANYLNKGVDITDIDISAAKTWILKKYILELAILTIWADKIVTEEETQFIGEMSDLLGFTREELEKSMLAIESFVLSNWGNIPFLQSKNSFDDIREKFVDRMSNVISKNQERIGTEIKESKELMDLLIKATKTDLSEEEQIKVRAQLIDILKTLPTFVIIALPGSFLTLPLLLKILPKSILPSAFHDA